MRAWLVVMAMAASAAAEPRVCTPKGGVLVEVGQRVARSALRSTAVTKLFGNGAWTVQVFDPGGKQARSSAGCLDDAHVAALRDELKAAPWKLAREAGCHSDSPRYQVFTARGAAHTLRACTSVDAATQRALDDLGWILPDLDPAGDPVKHPRLPQRCLDNPLADRCN